MILRIFLIPPATLERPDPRVPLVVATPAVAGARNSECGIAAWKVRLRMDHFHHLLRLRPLHIADERPKQVQAELHSRRSEDTPTSVGFSRATRTSDA